MGNLVELLAEAQAHRHSGQWQLAEQTCRHALEVDPASPAAHRELGLVLGNQGRLDEAVTCFRAAAARNPNDAQMLNNLGVTYRLVGRLDEAVASCRRAVQARPDYAEAHHSLGAALARQGRLDEAVACCRRAVELKPDYVEAHTSLGVALERQNKLDESAACFRQALNRGGETAEAHSNLAGVLDRQGKLDEAAAALKRALELNPQSPAAHVNLGVVLEHSDRLDDALGVLQRAVALAPNHADAHLNLAMVLDRMGDFDAALAAGRRAIQLDPNCATAHFNLAAGLLRQGRFEAGWPEYEWRAGLEGVNQPVFSQPRWTGQPIHGRTLLLVEEQGRGDTLQFVRFAEPIKLQGATLIVQCRPELAGLVGSGRGVDRVVATDAALPAFDFFLPLPSAPGVLRTSLDSIPANVPYLTADPRLAGSWRERLNAPGRLKVGIAWHGDPRNKSDRYRSIPLKEFAPLSGLRAVQLFSLQMGPGREQLARLTPPGPIIDLADGIRDFQDTAAITSNLDLVITCDTATAHLAGALGKPVWVAVPLSPDWRWMLGRSDNPWYPTARIYRQSHVGDWTTVFQAIHHDLTALAAGQRAAS